ncbi:MAG: hypothetical protein COT74_01175 [Bdellovibrionales bacterium CG10_big_fil_rev_8_21_14_0_10_45_34]|nr:MAG: hypothetical protein COT74_01175 [Bdellovibrionales bacterium CG10_big_fil_rev_8_21_14_0_10_45_34]
MKSKAFFIGLMALGALAEASTGGVDGGGGKSIICRDTNGAIKSAEVLDLYEGRVMFGLNIQETNEPMNLQIKRALDLIPANSRGIVEVYKDIVLKNMRITPPGTQLLPIDDSFEVIVPAGCSAEQAANYYNDKMILISGDIWSSLTETGKAALILHEAVYAANRLVGATNSRQSRHIVANIFDQSTKWTDIKDSLPEQALTCVTVGGGAMMWAFQKSDGSWMLQFQILGKSYVMSKKTFSVMNPEFDFNEAKKFPIVEGEDLIGSYLGITGVTESDFEGDDVLSVTKKWEAVRNFQGQIVRGFQTPRYYMSWRSSTFPNTSTSESLLNCSVVIP